LDPGDDLVNGLGAEDVGRDQIANTQKRRLFAFRLSIVRVDKDAWHVFLAVRKLGAELTIEILGNGLLCD
jgi:hypothetical protein